MPGLRASTPPRAASTRARPPAPPARELSADARAQLAAARAALLAYYDGARRDLPWRNTVDPYAIWVSEVMLQQTRVETVIPYYTRFLERFPTPRALAEADERAVLAAWSGLGYYRRAKLLHAGARAVLERHAGTLPDDPAALRAIPGVGAYTAGALASIAFSREEPLVDGNVERVLSRWFALTDDPKGTVGKKHLWALARAYVKGARPGDANQALMELGATVCTPRAPRCLVCPARASCTAYATGAPEQFPTKRERSRTREERWVALLVFRTDGAVLLEQAPPSGRWPGLLLPPMEQQGEERTNAAPAALLATYLTEPPVPQRAGSYTHVLTHAILQIDLYIAKGAHREPSRGRFYSDLELAHEPVPRLTRALLEQSHRAHSDEARAEPTAKHRRRAAAKR